MKRDVFMPRRPPREGGLFMIVLLKEEDKWLSFYKREFLKRKSRT